MLSFLVIFALLSAVRSFKAYKATEFVRFCGQSCHALYPEYTAYSASPHAKVACVDCHVGPGAGWYLRSTLSGLTELYATLRNTYPRPIPSPVKSLRPAQDTCEECHWSRKFRGAQLKTFTHFGSDEQNTPRAITLLIKGGGGDPTLGPAVRRNPLAHEHCQQDRVLRLRRETADHFVGSALEHSERVFNNYCPCRKSSLG